jgi:hypothetical protein
LGPRVESKYIWTKFETEIGFFKVLACSLKLFTAVIYEFLFVPGEAFQHSQMFVGKAGAYPQTLERLVRNKYSGVLRKSVNYSS